MMSERFPATTPEQKESDVTDDACREAMKAGDFARVAQWYEQQERRVDADPTADGRFRLTLRLARLQQEAGIIDD